MLVDFHMHTTFSDGKFTPNELVEKAIAANLKVIAITDHDEFHGFLAVNPSLLEDITIVPGIELSSTFYNVDVHILGYGFDTSNKRISDYVEFYKNERYTRMVRMVEACQKEGYKVSFEDLLSMFGSKASVGRPHLAQVLMKKGYIGSVKEGFDTILSHTSPCYVPKFKSQPVDIVDIIHEAGGIAVIAHPKLIDNDDYVTELLKLPFDGIEVYHSSHDEEDSLRYEQMAKERGLLISGGSDFHGIKGRNYPDALGKYIVTYPMVKEFITTLVPEVATWM